MDSFRHLPADARAPKSGFMPGPERPSSAPDDARARPRFGLWPVALALLASCGVQPPTAEEIHHAYAEHVHADRAHELGLQAKQAPVVVPQQEPRCTADGNAHFDCRIRVIFETDAGPRSQEQQVHIRRESGRWVIDSIN